MVSRAERTALANWWWTIDRWILAAVAALMVFGLVLTMAGSPPVAERLGLSTFHFVHRQVLFLIPSVTVLVATSFLSPRQVRRVALFVFLVSIALIIVALLYGHDIKGSRRWIFGVQPSEFLKPAFVVLVAWALSEAGKRRDVPANFLAVLLLLVTAVPLICNLISAKRCLSRWSGRRFSSWPGCLGSGWRALAELASAARCLLIN